MKNFILLFSFLLFSLNPAFAADRTEFKKRVFASCMNTKAEAARSAKFCQCFTKNMVVSDVSDEQLAYYLKGYQPLTGKVTEKMAELDNIFDIADVVMLDCQKN